jgi:hypothetical protein
VSGRLSGLLVAQALYLAVGAGLLPLLRIAPTPALLLRRLGLAYMVGLAVAGILAAHLALLDVPFGLLGLGLAAFASVALGWWQLRRAAVDAPLRTRAPRSEIEWVSLAVGVAATAILGVLLIQAATAFAVRPLKEWDGWAIWATKAKALYEFGGVNDLVFATYEPVAHPILLPSLEAIGFRAMGAFDGTLVHLQLVALAFGFAAGVWSLLGDRVPSAVLGVGLLALLSATPVLAQLSWNLADVPLAFFFALGLVCVARFLVAGEAWTLVVAALFLGASALTKSEGLLFAASAILAAAAVTIAAREWLRLAWIAVCAAVVLATIAPWRLYLAANDLRNAEYRLSDALHPDYLADRSERVRPAVSRLWDELWRPGWGMLPLLALVSIVAAALAGRYRLAAFALLWPIFAFGGLVIVYWISIAPIELTLNWTAGRVIVAPVIGAATLALLLVGEAWHSGGA